MKYLTVEHIKILSLLGLVGLVLVVIWAVKTYDAINLQKQPIFGLTFTPAYAQALGLNPRQIYQQLLHDLHPAKIRLSAYWDEIEPQENQFDFTDLDYYVSEAGKNQTNVVLAVGYKLPRWPECRVPTWMDKTNIQYRKEHQLVMLQKIIEYYERNPAVEAWQVENEPLFTFGTCDPPDREFLLKEVQFVKSLTKKPILLTDSGELSTWIDAMKLSDYFGTTLYRTVHQDLFGYFPYPLQPWFYRVKSNLVRNIFAPQNQKSIVIELQAEPWAPIFIADIPIKEQIRYFTVQDMKKNIEFAKKVGFDEIYLWGVEWWYWMAKQGQKEYLELAKSIY